MSGSNKTKKLATPTTRSKHQGTAQGKTDKHKAKTNSAPNISSDSLQLTRLQFTYMQKNVLPNHKSKNDTKVSLGNDYTIQITGKFKDKVEKEKKSLQDEVRKIHHDATELTSLEKEVLMKDVVKTSIDKTLKIKQKSLVWDVEEIVDQPQLVVASSEKEVRNAISDIMQCLTKVIKVHRSLEGPLQTFMEKENESLAYHVNEKEIFIIMLKDTETEFKKWLNDVSSMNLKKTDKDTLPGQETEEGDKFTKQIEIKNQMMVYFKKHLQKSIEDLCIDLGVKFQPTSHLLNLSGTKKNVKKAHDNIKQQLKDLATCKGFAKCSQRVVPDSCLETMKNEAEDHQCVVKISRCKLDLSSAWLPTVQNEQIEILFMIGPIDMAQVDVLLCPMLVDKSLKPIGNGQDIISQAGDIHNECQEYKKSIGSSEFHSGDSIPIYNTGNLQCLCLFLMVVDHWKKGVAEKDIRKLVDNLIKYFNSTGYNSIGISLNTQINKPESKQFTERVLKAIWNAKTNIKHEIQMHCYCDNEDVIEQFDTFFSKELIDRRGYELVDLHIAPVVKEDRKCSLDITVEQGSIVDYDRKVDVIVNSTSHLLELEKGMVSQQLVTKAGVESIKTECKAKFPDGISLGGIAITGAGMLQCHKLFHGALYHWIQSGDISVKILQSVISRCLFAAEEHRCESIAFPALGAGTLRYPPYLVSKVMFETVEAYGKAETLRNLKKVYFVLFDGGTKEVFDNTQQWMKTRKPRHDTYDIPPRHIQFVCKDLETRICIADRDFHGGLNYQEFRVVFKVSEKEDKELKLEWDVTCGCFAACIQTDHKEQNLRHWFYRIIGVMERKRLHVVDLVLITDLPGMTAQNQIDILIDELKKYINGIYHQNPKKSANQHDRYIVIKVVRIFLPAKDYEDLAQHYISSRHSKDDFMPEWHVADYNPTEFKFNIEVVGAKSKAEDVNKKLQQVVSSVSQVGDTCATNRGMKPLDEGKAQSKKETETDHNKQLSMVMSEDDYAALVYVSLTDTWFSKLKSHNYNKGKAVFDIKSSSDVKGFEECINSKLHRLQQFTTVEVIPPTNIKDQFGFLQSEVEKSAKGAYCFLSYDEKKIIIRADGYELAQQAKHMVEVNLGMTSQGGGRRNRKFASPDAVGQGPVARQTSVPDSGIKDGAKFQTAEGIKVYIYCAGIGQLDVDTLVNAANKDLQHGGGIAYHISSAAGYALEKECDDIVKMSGSLKVGTCCSTTAGNLPYKSIIHAVGPMWHSYPHNKKQQCLDNLKLTVISAINEAESQNLKSIAIPSISSGIFGVPKEVCAQQYYNAVVEYSKRNGGKSTIREIHFIDKDRGMCSLIQKTFEKEFGFAGQKM